VELAVSGLVVAGQFHHGRLQEPLQEVPPYQTHLWVRFYYLGIRAVEVPHHHSRSHLTPLGDGAVLLNDAPDLLQPVPVSEVGQTAKVSSGGGAAQSGQQRGHGSVTVPGQQLVDQVGQQTGIMLGEHGFSLGREGVG